MNRSVRTPSGRPNIVLLMADQLAAPALPFYGRSALQAPNLQRLAKRGMVFERAYCNFPTCAPSRYSMLTGRLPHSIDAFDNACELPSSLPTMAHYLGAAGYRTILAGKMHFVGADQLHGFAERLTTDIYPSEFLWVPDWSKGPAYRPTGVGMSHVVDAGPSVRNMQIDYDEEVEHVAVQKIYDLARDSSGDPFFLTVSFTHPHPPFVASQTHWDRWIPIPRSCATLRETPPLPLSKAGCVKGFWLIGTRSRRTPGFVQASVGGCSFANLRCATTLFRTGPTRPDTVTGSASCVLQLLPVRSGQSPACDIRL